MKQKQYENKRTGKIVNLVSEDKKFKTVLIQDVETEETTVISKPTFSRWYKVIGSDEPEEDVTEQNVVTSEQEEPTESKEPVDRDAITNELLEYFQSLENFQARLWHPYSVAVKINNKPVLEFRVLKSGKVTIYTKEDYLKGMEHTILKGYYLPCVLKRVDAGVLRFLFDKDEVLLESSEEEEQEVVNEETNVEEDIPNTNVEEQEENDGTV